MLTIETKISNARRVRIKETNIEDVNIPEGVMPLGSDPRRRRIY